MQSKYMLNQYKLILKKIWLYFARNLNLNFGARTTVPAAQVRKYQRFAISKFPGKYIILLLWTGYEGLIRDNYILEV